MTRSMTGVVGELLVVCLGETLLAIVLAVLFHFLRTPALSVTRQTVVLALGAGVGSIIVFIPMIFLIDHMVLSLATR